MKTRKIIFLILIIINCITIFYFSNQVADTSSTSSGRVVNVVMKIVLKFRNMEEHEKEYVANEVLQPIVRKLAHFSIYTSLGFWIMNYAMTYQGQKVLHRGRLIIAPTFLNRFFLYKNKRNGKERFEIIEIILYSWIFGTLYAISDEIHQLFIQGRSCEFRDVCIDSLGVLTGITIMVVIIKIFAKLKKANSKGKEKGTVVSSLK